MNPETDASELLNVLWRGKSHPVDPVQIARDLGLNVVEADLPENVSGALIKDTDKDPVIFLSKSDSNNRKRFTCAHEIGHYVYRLANNGSHYEYVDLRDDSSSRGDNNEEIYANQFAANLLMPAKAVKRLHSQGLPIFLIAQHFGVSDDAIRFRLKNLGLVSWVMSERTQLTDQSELIKKLLALKSQGGVTKLDSLDPLTQAQIDDQLADTELKKRYANWFIGILIGQLLVMNLIFIAAGINWLHFEDPTHLNLFMGGTLAEVFGVVMVITRYLFSKK